MGLRGTSLAFGATKRAPTNGSSSLLRASDASMLRTKLPTCELSANAAPLTLTMRCRLNLRAVVESRSTMRHCGQRPSKKLSPKAARISLQSVRTISSPSD